MGAWELLQDQTPHVRLMGQSATQAASNPQGHEQA